MSSHSYDIKKALRAMVFNPGAESFAEYLQRYLDGHQRCRVRGIKIFSRYTADGSVPIIASGANKSFAIKGTKSMETLNDFATVMQRTLSRSPPTLPALPPESRLQPQALRTAQMNSSLQPSELLSPVGQGRLPQSLPQHSPVTLPRVRIRMGSRNINRHLPASFRNTLSLDSLPSPKLNKRVRRREEMLRQSYAEKELTELDPEARILLERHLRMRHASRRPDMLKQAIGAIW